MVESLRVVDIAGCVGVLLTLGEPTGLGLPEVEVPSGRLVPTVGEIAGGVTEDMTIVGGFTDTSRFVYLFLIALLVSTDKVDGVDIAGDDVAKCCAVVVAVVFISPGGLASMLLVLCTEFFCVSRLSLRTQAGINERDTSVIRF